MNSILEETEEQLEQFVTTMARGIDGQELATPRMFGTLSNEELEDLLDNQYEDDAGQTAHEETGEHDRTIEREDQRATTRIPLNKPDHKIKTFQQASQENRKNSTKPITNVLNLIH